MWVWAHRGASGTCPENTLEAFEQAVQEGADGVELDVQRTKDGHLIVIHDETVDRVSEGTGKVAHQTLKKLQALNAAARWQGGGTARFPTLAEVFDLLRGGGLVVNVELKTSIEPYPGIEGECIALARQMGMAERVWFSSFNHHSLLRVKELAPQFPCGLLYEATMVRPWEYARALGMNALHPHFSELYVPGEVQHCHALGIRVHTWTVNDPEAIAAVLRAGADAVITNHPGLARRVIQEAGQLREEP